MTDPTAPEPDPDGGSVASRWSAGSVASYASAGSAFSILSVGSFASIASIGSSGKIGHIGDVPIRELFTTRPRRFRRLRFRRR